MIESNQPISVDELLKRNVKEMRKEQTMKNGKQTKLIAILATAALLVAGLSGCSSKVYTTQKNIVYKGDIYNLGNFQRVGSRIEGRTPDDKTVNLRNLDRKGVKVLLDQHDSVLVLTVVELDQQEMIYQRAPVSKYSDYSKMVKKLDRALKDITKFLANKKSTQLKLK